MIMLKTLFQHSLNGTISHNVQRFEMHEEKRTGERSVCVWYFRVKQTLTIIDNTS